MRLKITPLYLIAFLCMVFLFTQLHELSHIITGRLICGCWGQQVDFNLWDLCGDCGSTNPNVWGASIAGPLFSYLMMWTGLFLMRWGNPSKIFLGFNLTLSNIPFARMVTVAMGGGDELVAFRYYFLSDLPVWEVRLITTVIVFVLALPPLYMCYRSVKNSKKFLMIAGFCILPLIIQMLYQFKLLGLVLQSGFMATTRFMGIADLIHVHTAVVVVVLALVYRRVTGSTLLPAKQAA